MPLGKRQTEPEPEPEPDPRLSEELTKARLEISQLQRKNATLRSTNEQQREANVALAHDLERAAEAVEQIRLAAAADGDAVREGAMGLLAENEELMTQLAGVEEQLRRQSLAPSEGLPPGADSVEVEELRAANRELCMVLIRRDIAVAELTQRLEGLTAEQNLCADRMAMADAVSQVRFESLVTHSSFWRCFGSIWCVGSISRWQGVCEEIMDLRRDISVTEEIWNQRVLATAVSSQAIACELRVYFETDWLRLQVRRIQLSAAVRSWNAWSGFATERLATRRNYPVSNLQL